MLGLTPEPVQTEGKVKPLSLEQAIVEGALEVAVPNLKSVLTVGILSIISTNGEAPVPIFWTRMA
jgi:hypothetical protein